MEKEDVTVYLNVLLTVIRLMRSIIGSSFTITELIDPIVTELKTTSKLNFFSLCTLSDNNFKK